MKEKWTKLGKSLICLALVTSMLAGCGGGGKSSSSSGEQTSGGTSGEVATGDDNFNETGLPIVKEPVELTFLYVKGANTMDFKDNAMFQQMEKDTNVKINWQYAGDADWSEQKSLLLASGDLPDVFFGDNALKDNDIATNLDMFIPLEDYVEKYCPNIKAAWEAEPTMRQMLPIRTAISILCPVRSLCVRRAAIRPLSTRHGWIVWVWKCPPPWTSGTKC